MTQVVHTRDALAAALAGADEIAVVMTMGALHEGHRQLIRVARERAPFVVVTIFVNPLQFGPNEDFEKYPRTLEEDLAACRAEGAAVVFAPGRDDVYPDGPPSITMNPGPLGEILEGASRPGHFSGMLTVVEKLLRLTRADVAFFGEKDFQQLALIRRMVADLELDVEIVGVPTVREIDGLALSSRNRYLGAADRTAALALSRALREGAAHHEAGAVLAAAHKILQDEPAVRVDYLELTGADLGPVPADGPARLLVAARVGATRLIDNVPIVLRKDA
ncbi:pantoate--beta-alanine ligase [Actinoplanes sp. SE50]|uniref:pantoate--beta-alanine ligase n=1 Tax=unclassified Actinoplanes TaxID=2626549 RepID=UPI00023EE000|nr:MULTISPECIES: pantoate--beta-alanine ligase [unclassified Actinoplanes]AEV88942.1 pantoate-beta-alanine ligase [Actinoplanes sp. SE50/110]ATO87348.1 pantoate--beta-alanine ligase [Actinoplanes sp. SE50]SLM04766.1 pantoate--beta-alanine ligase [Actinoplanes sp. SE50/110]